MGYILVPASSFSPIFVHRPAFVLSVPPRLGPHTSSLLPLLIQNPPPATTMKLQLFLAAPPTPLSFFPSLQDSKISGQGYSTDHPRVLSLVFANAVPTIFPPSSILVNNSTTLGSNFILLRRRPATLPFFDRRCLLVFLPVDRRFKYGYFTFLSISLSLKTGVPILMSDLEYISNDDILAKNNERDFIQSKNKKGKKNDEIEYLTTSSRQFLYPKARSKRKGIVELSKFHNDVRLSPPRSRKIHYTRAFTKRDGKVLLLLS